MSNPTTPLRAGDVRLIGGVPSLILRAEKEIDGTILACPVKERASNEETTGHVVFLDENHAALPQFGAGIYPEYVGEFLWRCFQQQLEQVRAGWTTIFRDVPTNPFDSIKPNSEEDWELYRRMSASSMERVFSLEAATYIEEADGTWREETRRERRNRLARRRRALKK